MRFARLLLPVGAVLAVAAGSSAHAQYMAVCDALIEQWKACGSNVAACAAAEISIMTQCKCHALNDAGDDWVVASNTLAVDDVCGRMPTTVLKKPPPEPGGDPRNFPGGKPGDQDGTPGTVYTPRDQLPNGGAAGDGKGSADGAATASDSAASESASGGAVGAPLLGGSAD